MKGRKYLVYVIVLLVAVILTVPLPASIRAKAAARDGVAPFQNVLTLVVQSVNEKWRSISEADKALDEKKQLMEEVARLRLRLRDLEAAGLENDRLRGMLAFRKRQGRKLLLCEVIARGDASGWWQTVTINKGSDDGIKPDMAVITMDGLVGRTRKEVSRYSCDVLLVTDQTSRIACRLKRAGALGIARGAGVSAGGKSDLAMITSAPSFQADYIDKNASVLDNDEVETSGLGGVYPEGIMLGYVKKSVMDSSGLFRQAEIVPAADLKHLRFVFVIID